MLPGETYKRVREQDRKAQGSGQVCDVRENSLVGWLQPDFTGELRDVSYDPEVSSSKARELGFHLSTRTVMGRMKSPHISDIPYVLSSKISIYFLNIGWLSPYYSNLLLEGFFEVGVPWLSSQMAWWNPRSFPEARLEWWAFGEVWCNQWTYRDVLLAMSWPLVYGVEEELCGRTRSLIPGGGRERRLKNQI